MKTSNSTTKNLKVCIIGCGYAANELHIPAINKIRHAKIVAVCDTNEELAKNTAKINNIPNYYSDLTAALDSETIDIVDITTPPRTHHILANNAMNNGCHVLVEKPMCISPTEADDMIATSRKNNVKLCIDHNGLFNPAVLAAKRFLQDGYIGDLLSVDVKILEKNDILGQKDHWCHSLPGGVMNEIAPHAVYLTLTFLRDVSIIHTIGKKFSQYPWINYDEIKTLLKAENALGSIYVSCNSPRTSICIDLYGSKKILSIDNFTMNIRSLAERKITPLSLAQDNFSQCYQLTTGTFKTAVKTIFGLNPRSYTVLISKFIESILNDSEVPVVPEEGKETVRILENIFKTIS